MLQTINQLNVRSFVCFSNKSSTTGSKSSTTGTKVQQRVCGDATKANPQCGGSGCEKLVVGKRFRFIPLRVPGWRVAHAGHPCPVYSVRCMRFRLAATGSMSGQRSLLLYLKSPLISTGFGVHLKTAKFGSGAYGVAWDKAIYKNNRNIFLLIRPW